MQHIRLQTISILLIKRLQPTII